MIAALVDRALAALERGRERRQALALDDRILHDIAASRADIERLTVRREESHGDGPANTSKRATARHDSPGQPCGAALSSGPGDGRSEP